MTAHHPDKFLIAAELTDAAFSLARNEEFEAAGRLLRAAECITEVSTSAAMFHYCHARGACSLGHKAIIPENALRVRGAQ